jgi:hypothetical protein
MRFKIIKKEDRGFALLFSVLVSSLLLTIGLSIFSIALKELAISTATRQSVHAFYAADSGREQAKYLDTKTQTLFSFNPNLSEAISTSTSISGIVDGADGPNFTVQIKKTRDNNINNKILTEITSRGYDTDSGDKVERAIFQSY